MQTTDSIKAARDVVNVVAADSSVAKVIRMISFFNRVTSWRREKSEDISLLVSRLCGLATTHLEYANVSSTSPICQVFEITLLKNAGLHESKLTQCKLQLIILAKS